MIGLPCREQRVKTGRGAGCLDRRGRWAELLFSSQKSMGDDLLEISRVFHLHVATLDHGSRLDAILNRESKASNTGAHLGNMAAQRLPVPGACEGGSTRHPH